MDDPADSSTARRPSGPITASVAAYVGIAALAFVVRLVPLLRGGGLGSYGRYDDGVYYAASDALTFGRMPYRDFVLLHPPGLPLVLTPFAALGRLTGDNVGMATGRIAFMLIGALNAVLVARVAARWSRRGGVAAGVIYACWLAAAYAEQSTLLEPLGTTATLGAVLLLTRAATPSARACLTAGAVLGAGATLKIWYVAPWLAIAAWQLVSRRVAAAVQVVAAGAAVVVVVLLPFAVAAPRAMFDMVVRDQVLRPVAAASRIDRLPVIVGIKHVLPSRGPSLTVAAVVILIALVAAALLCLRLPGGGIVTTLVLVDGAVLIASPSFFGHYSHLLAAPASAAFGIAVGRIATGPGRARHVAVPVVCLLMLLSAVRVIGNPVGRRVDGAALARAAAPGCVASDSPDVLIEMNRLSADLRHGCRLPVDVSGITYDSLHRVDRNGHVITRAHNSAWQHYLCDYLTSSPSYAVVRSKTMVSPRVYRVLTGQPVLARSHAVVLYKSAGVTC